MNVYPDGGVSRLRVWGTATQEGRNASASSLVSVRTRCGVDLGIKLSLGQVEALDALAIPHALRCEQRCPVGRPRAWIDNQGCLPTRSATSRRAGAEIFPCVRHMRCPLPSVTNTYASADPTNPSLPKV